MLETARERVSLLKAGVDGKTIEHLYILLNNFNLVGCNSRKINCWEFVGCNRKSGEESEGCKASIDTSADGINGGINGGRVCWFISGTFNGDKVEGNYAKKLLSCLKNNTNESMAETTGSI